MLTKALKCIVTAALFVSLYTSAYAAPPGGEWQRILNDFEAYAETVRTDWQVPGLAVAVVHDDQLVFAKGFGIRRADAPEAPVSEETVFQIGSVSKSFTAALVAMMVDEGHFHWSSQVRVLYPEFEMMDAWVSREFMVYDLMAQHSGMAPYAGDIQAFLGFDREHIIHSLRHMAPVSSFRSNFAYVNNLFLVAAKLVEQASGKSWEENLEQRIFTPLGMSASSSDIESLAQVENRSAGHARVAGKTLIRDTDWPFIDWVYTYGPAGGVNSNVLDMAKWARLHLQEGAFQGEQLVSSESMNFMHTPHTIIMASDKGPLPDERGPLMGRGMYYGQGWLSVEADYAHLVWHNGGTSGFQTVVALAPAEELGVVVLSNLSGTNVPEILAQRLFDLYFGRELVDYSQRALKKRAEAEDDAQQVQSGGEQRPPRPWAEYAGEYDNPVFDTAQVCVKEEGLILRFGPENHEILLQHLDGDRFAVRIPALPEITGQVRFEANEEGRIASLSADFIDDGSTPKVFHRKADDDNGEKG